MTGRVRRRRIQERSVTARWSAERDAAIRGSERLGMGIRPEGWWLYESGRPDLAPGAGPGDAYAYLPGMESMAASVERLRHLIRTGELTDVEVQAIRERHADPRLAGDSSSYQWRVAILDEPGSSR